MEGKQIKLFAFKPDGHGSHSFFVMATSKAEAISMIDAHISKKYRYDAHEISGWPGNYYLDKIAYFSEVAENCND